MTRYTLRYSMNGRLVRVLTMTRRIITLLQACNCPLYLCGAFPTIPVRLQTNSRHSSHGPRRGMALWPSGWRLSFHISIKSRQLLFVFGQGFGSSPSSNSLHPSIAADRFLKRSEQRWEWQPPFSPLLPGRGRPSIRIWAALSQQCSDSYRCGS